MIYNFQWNTSLWFTATVLNSLHPWQKWISNITNKDHIKYKVYFGSLLYNIEFVFQEILLNLYVILRRHRSHTLLAFWNKYIKNKIFKKTKIIHYISQYQCKLSCRLRRLIESHDFHGKDLRIDYSYFTSSKFKASCCQVCSENSFLPKVADQICKPSS